MQSTKIKCSQGHCEHKGENEIFDTRGKIPIFLSDEFHEEGLCWKITQDEFQDHPTNAKYCPCSRGSELIRRYERVGYMERGQHDIMITRKCETCDTEALFTINQRRCLTCRAGDYK